MRYFNDSLEKDCQRNLLRATKNFLKRAFDRDINHLSAKLFRASYSVSLHKDYQEMVSGIGFDCATSKMFSSSLKVFADKCQTRLKNPHEHAKFVWLTATKKFAEQVNAGKKQTAQGKRKK